MEISLCATVIAIEIARPATAPNAAATDAVPAVDVIVEASSASSVTLRALMPPVFVPSMNALTRTAILLTTPTPAPLRAPPTRPAESATEPEKTNASIVWVPRAVSFRSPALALTLERSR